MLIIPESQQTITMVTKLNELHSCYNEYCLCLKPKGNKKIVAKGD